MLWKRKWSILGSRKAIFELHSGAMGRKNGEVRFQKRSFAAQTTTSKHALTFDVENEQILVLRKPFLSRIASLRGEKMAK